MELKEFAAIVCEGIQKEMGDGYRIFVTPHAKDASSKRTGIVFDGRQGDIVPAVFIDDLFVDYREKGKDVPRIVKEVIKRYEKSMETVTDIHRLDLDWDSCRKRVIYLLVSRQRCRKMLRTMPYIPFLDMAITFHLLVSIDQTNIQTIKIDHELQERWDVSVEQLLKSAENNTEQLLPLELYDMEQLAARHGYASVPQEEEFDNTNMIVLTNCIGIYGASAVLYRGVLEMVAQEMGCDIYVIPSSVHEMILVPVENEDIYHELLAMIQEINDQFVASDEVLSDQIYVFERKERKFVIRE